MDIQALMNSMLSSDSIKSLSKVTGTTQKDVKKVLGSALPDLINGAVGQANDAGTAEGFVGALSDHAKDDTTDIASFLSNVDLQDGGKILGHLLGSGADAATEKAAAEAGVEKAQSGSILSAAAPLLMSLLGQQTSAESEQNNSSGIAGLMGSLLGNVDLGSLLGGLLGGSDSEEETTTTTSTGKKKKKKKKKNDKEESSGGILNSILSLFK